MATYNGVNAAKIAAITPATVLDPGEQGGNVRCLVDTYVGLGTESAAETIALGGALPVGAKVLYGMLGLDTTGNTPDLGDGVTAALYLDEATDNTVTPFTAVDSINKEIASTTTQFTLTLDAAVTSAGVITLIVFYTVE